MISSQLISLLEVIEGLDRLVELDTLNLSQNMFTSIEGLDKLMKLNTLLLKVHPPSCYHHYHYHYHNHHHLSSFIHSLFIA
jgi:hypothetical protein